MPGTRAMTADKYLTMGPHARRAARVAPHVERSGTVGGHSKTNAEPPTPIAVPDFFRRDGEVDSQRRTDQAAKSTVRDELWAAMAGALNEHQLGQLKRVRTWTFPLTLIGKRRAAEPALALLDALRASRPPPKVFAFEDVVESLIKGLAVLKPALERYLAHRKDFVNAWNGLSDSALRSCARHFPFAWPRDVEEQVRRFLTAVATAMSPFFTDMGRKAGTDCFAVRVLRHELARDIVPWLAEVVEMRLALDALPAALH